MLWHQHWMPKELTNLSIFPFFWHLVSFHYLRLAISRWPRWPMVTQNFLAKKLRILWKKFATQPPPKCWHLLVLTFLCWAQRGFRTNRFRIDLVSIIQDLSKKILGHLGWLLKLGGSAGSCPSLYWFSGQIFGVLICFWTPEDLVGFLTKTLRSNETAGRRCSVSWKLSCKVH